MAGETLPFPPLSIMDIPCIIILLIGCFVAIRWRLEHTKVKTWELRYKDAMEENRRLRTNYKILQEQIKPKKS